MITYMTVRECYELISDGNPIEIDGIEYVQLQGWV